MTNLKQYEESVKNLASKGEDFNFPNSDPKHATIVTSTILNISKEVQFYVKNFDGSIADNILEEIGDKRPRFIDSLSYFLAIGNKIQIVIEEPNNNSSNNKISEFYTFLKEEVENSKPNLEIKLASSTFKENIREGLKLETKSSDFFFMVGDDKSFRINFDRKQGKSVCNFNSPKIAKRLSMNFNKGFASCSKFVFND